MELPANSTGILDAISDTIAQRNLKGIFDRSNHPELFMAATRILVVEDDDAIRRAL